MQGKQIFSIALLTLASFTTHPNATWSASGPKPKYGPEATPLSMSHGFFQKTESPHFWTLMPYYIPQQYGWSCSVASVAMLVNAARANEKQGSEDALVSQDDLIKKAHFPDWENNMKGTGRGVNLDSLGKAIEASLKTYQIQQSKIEVVHIENNSPETQNQLHQTLLESQKKNGPYIIANFLQGVYTGDAPVGHVAPVGAYDSETKKVLILDPDREYYEPYWISEKTFLNGMKTADKQSGKNRGYVIIRLRERQSTETH